MFGLNNVALAETPTTVSELMEVLKEEKKDAVYNISLNAPFTKENSGVNERVNTETGEVIIKNNIFHIPGRNGMDISLNLEYRSRDAKVYEEGTKSNSVSNNYGQKIIAYYDVFDSNDYWLRTGALLYTTSDSTILGEVTMGSEKWVFTGYLQHESGTSILNSGNITNNAREKSIVSASKYIFGEGWSLDIPYLDVDVEDDVYVHLPNGQTYKANFDNGIGLQDYELTDIIFTKDTTSGNGIEKSAYKLGYINGDSYYFTNKGELILEKDKFNNKISYYWEEIDGKRLLKRVLDSVGRSVDILYNDTTTIFKSGTSSVRFVKTPISGEEGKYYLSSFVDAAGRHTRYGYTFDKAEFDSIGEPPANNLYVNLTEIVYPTGVKTQYQYTKSTKNLGSSGYMEYFKVKERFDLIDDKVYNQLKYQYYNEPDGYPTYKVSTIDELYKYFTNVIDSNGLTTRYMYNSKHQEYTKEQYLDNKLLKQVRTNYNVKLNLPTKVITKTFNTKGNSSEKIDTYDYDYRGNLIAENHPIDSRRVSSDEYKTFYTYDDEYNLLTSKKYKTDEDTTVQIKYNLGEDKRYVDEEKVYSNGNLISNKAYKYDKYGNIISLSIEKEPGYWITDRFEYSSDYKGAYLTSVVYEDIIDADGNTNDIKIEYTYDYNTGNKLSQIDGNGNTVSFRYDKLDRLTKEILPDNLSRLYEYDDNNNTLSVTDANRNQLIYYYDKLGKLMKVVEPIDNQALVNLEYDENENLISEKDGNENIKKYEYDRLKRIKEVTSIDRKGILLSQTKVGYNEAYEDRHGNTYFKVTVSNKGDSYDKVTKYYFDKFDRLIKQGRMNGSLEETAEFKYNYLDNQIEIRNFAGEKVKYQYDALGRLIKGTDGNGNSTSYKYDSLGNLVSQTDEIGQTVFFEYDRLGRKISERLPFERDKYSTTKLYYDEGNNLTKIIDPEGYITKQYYTNRNLLSAVEKIVASNESYLTKIEYDGEGNIKNIQKGLDGWNDLTYSQVSYEYDSLNRLTTQVNESGKKTSYRYDNNSNLTEVIDRNGIITYITYDGLNRVVKKHNSKDGAKTAVDLSYDKLGNTTKITDESGTRTFKYDDLGRLELINYDNGIRQYYSYDKSDRITRFKVKQGSSKEIDLKYSYDKIGRLTKVNDSGKNFAYQYDAIGRLTEEVNGVTGIRSKYQYYPSGNLRKLIHYNGEEIENSFMYRYDLRGNQTKKIEGKDITNYYYDSLSRIKTVLNSDGIQNYKYDDLNNISEVVEIKGNNISETHYTYDLNNSLILKETQNGSEQIQQRFEYDLEGNMLNKEEVIKYRDNLISNKVTKYLYNGNNRVSQVIDPNNRIISYIYNNEGLRTKKDFGAEAINYYYDRGNIVLETNKDNFITAKNIRGNKLIYRDTNKTSPYYYLHNAHGDVVKLLNEKGKLIKDYSYQPFGLEKAKLNNSFGNKQFTGIWQQEIENIDNPFRYSGEYLDEETGNYYLRARYYDPSIQRFITEDSYKGRASEPFSLNLYTYTYNNPIKYVDPSGHMPTKGEEFSYSAEGTSKGEINPEDGMKYMQIIEEKVRENGDFMHRNIEEVPDEYEGVLKQFIVPNVRVYGITGSLGPANYSVGIAYDQSGDWKIVYGGEGPAKAGLPLEASAMFFYSESYDANVVEEAEGGTVNIVNIDGGFIIIAGKSYSKSLPDGEGKQTTWYSKRLGYGYGFDFSASYSHTKGIDPETINNSLENRINRLKDIK